MQFPSRARMRRHRLMGIPSQARLSSTKSRKPCKICSKKSVRIHHVSCGTHPCDKSTSLNMDERMAKKDDTDMLRLMGNAAKSRRMEVGKISCLIEGVTTILLCIFFDSSPRKYFT